MFTSEETHALKVYELYELLLKLPSDTHDELFKRGLYFLHKFIKE